MKSKPMSKCPNCALPSETHDKLCHSCTAIFQGFVELTLKRSIMIRYAPLYFYDAICLYRSWLNENRWKRLLKRARVIADWLDRNKRNKAQKKKYQDLHVMFVEFLASPFTSQAEEQVEEMFKMLESR